MFGDFRTVLGPNKMWKKQTTGETNTKTHETIKEQWSVTLCSVELNILKSNNIFKNAKKNKVNIRLDICRRTFHEGTGA